MKKKILYIFLAVVLIVVAYEIYQWNKPHRTSEGEKPVASLSAQDLFTQFETDETAANAAYLDKVVEVSGTVTSVATEVGNTVVYLQTTSDMGSISCSLSPDQKSSLKIGDSAVLKGICKGYNMDVILEQGTVIE